MTRRLPAWLLDVDGTLVDSNNAHARAWALSFSQHGFDVPLERINGEIGKGGDKLIRALLGRNVERLHGEALSTDHDREFRRLAEHTRLPPFAGAEAFVKTLVSRGHPVALATSSNDEQLDVLFASAGVDFRTLVPSHTTADDVEESKPAPDIVQTALRKLGVTASQSVMLGDTPHDGQSAQAAGVVFLGVETGGHGREALKAAGAREVWPSVAEVSKAIERLTTTSET